MKKTIILAIALLAGCSSVQTVEYGSLEIEIPSGWVAGISGNGQNSVFASVYTKSAGNTMESVMAIVEQMIDRPSMTPNPDGTITLAGETLFFHPAVFVRTDHFSMTCRDLEVETKRIEKTNKSSNVTAIDLAKINVIENALMLEEAYARNMMPDDNEITASVNSDFAQALKGGLSSEKFLANWGITLDEFRMVSISKLLFARLVSQAAKDAKSDSEYAKLATQYRTELSAKIKYSVYDPEPKKVVVVVREVGDAIVAVKGFGANLDVAGIARSIKVSGNPVDGEVFLAGQSD